MEMNKNLILIGMMASGKSTIGRLLAKKLSKKFFDTDFIIEKKLGMKIAQIFKKKGEFKFRELERKIILKLLKKKGCIISFGGGAFLNKTIRKVANEKGITVWLNWNSKTLIDRINKKKNKRPIASNLPNSKLKDLMLVRSKFYSKAKYKIECENMEKNEVVNKIINEISL